MQHTHRSSPPAEFAKAPTPATVHRAKRLGGPIAAPSYARAKTVMAHVIDTAMRRHTSQRHVALTAGVSRALVQQWISATGSNGLRLDLLVAIAIDGGAGCRAFAIEVLGEAMALVTAANDVGT